MEEVGSSPHSLGCEICQPTVASILSSLFNEHVMAKPHHDLQETNDRFLANIQRNGTFSVVPRVAGGEITPRQLIVMGQVAEKHGLYCKITGGQRIDMFGAKKEDLLDIWQDLVDAGMESGHAYAKALRTVKVSFLRRGIVATRRGLTVFRAVLARVGADTALETAWAWRCAWRSGTRASARRTR